MEMDLRSRLRKSNFLIHRISLYGKEVHAALWWPLLKARRVQRAALGDLSGDSDDDYDESEDEEG